MDAHARNKFSKGRHGHGAPDPINEPVADLI